jgi:peptidoglycan hydrolase-like protein with peptidoglycan-binding domain
MSARRSLAIVILCLAAMLGQTGSAVAQQVWIQVEAQNTLKATRERAQAYAQNFPDVHAFRTQTNWNAIVIGPLPADEAANLLVEWRADGRIPRDALLNDGGNLGTQLWPLSAEERTAADASATDADPAPTETASTETALTETAAADEPEEPAIVEPVLEPDPDLNATKRAEQKWSREDKKLYQTWLVWTGDYDSAIDGAYGRGTRSAIASFQEREGFEPTGYLRDVQVRLLKKRYDESIARLAIKTVRDLDAGIEIDMPLGFVAFDRFDPPFVRYSDTSGSGVNVSLISQTGDAEDLGALHDQLESGGAVPPEGYRVQRRDWFVLSGRDDRIVSYTYARTEKGLIKGFTLTWPPELDYMMQPFATLMYNSFAPIQDYVLKANTGPDTGADGPLDLTTGLTVEAPLRALSGFYVNADGIVVTHSAELASCGRITVGNGTDYRVAARDDSSELVILAPIGRALPPSFALFSTENPVLGADITVAGFSYPDVMEVATLNFGTLTDTSGTLGAAAEVRVSAFLEDGDVGGPVLDDRGAVIGMQLRRDDANGSLPEYVNFALKSREIMALLDQKGIIYGRASSIDAAAPEDLAAMAAGFTVKVSCWK